MQLKASKNNLTNILREGLAPTYRKGRLIRHRRVQGEMCQSQNAFMELLKAQSCLQTLTCLCWKN